LQKCPREIHGNPTEKFDEPRAMTTYSGKVLVVTVNVFVGSQNT